MEPRVDDVETLYFLLLERWNERNAKGMAALFVPQASVIGFDGTELDGRESIEASMRAIFASHPTPAYVGKVRSVRLFDRLAILRAVAGMVPERQNDLKPDLHAMQSVVASLEDGVWRIELFHNTPAAFHDRPQARERLTAELREVLRRTRGRD